MLAYLAVFIGTIGHASSEFFSVYSGLKGPEVTVWRFLMGSLGLLVACILIPSARDLVTPLREDGLRIFVLGVCGMAMAQLVFHWSLDYATITQVATMVTTMPILVVIINWLVLRTRISAPKIVSGLGAVAGIAFLLTDGYLARLAGSSESFRGVLLALGSALLGATYTVMVRPTIAKYGAIRITTLVFSLGALALWPIVGLIWGIWINPFTLFDRDPQAWACILTLGFWNTTIAMVIFFWGLSVAPDQGRANYIFFLKPVIAACLGYFIVRQDVTFAQIIAIIVITACVLVEVFWDQIEARWKGTRNVTGS